MIYLFFDEWANSFKRNDPKQGWENLNGQTKYPRAELEMRWPNNNPYLSHLTSSSSKKKKKRSNPRPDLRPGKPIRLQTRFFWVESAFRQPNPISIVSGFRSQETRPNISPMFHFVHKFWNIFHSTLILIFDSWYSWTHAQDFHA